MKNILKFAPYGFLTIILTGVTGYAILNKEEFVAVISGFLLFLAIIQLFLTRKA